MKEIIRRLLCAWYDCEQARYNRIVLPRLAKFDAEAEAARHDYSGPLRASYLDYMKIRDKAYARQARVTAIMTWTWRKL